MVQDSLKLGHQNLHCPSTYVPIFGCSNLLLVNHGGLVLHVIETCPLVNMCRRVKRRVIFGIAFIISVQVFWVFFSQSDLTEFPGN